jgi:hypothetical protein
VSKFKLEQTDRGFMHLVFMDCHRREARLIEVSSVMEPRVYFGTGDNLVLNQQIVKGLLPYLQEFAATGRFGRRPIQQAFMDPSIERLADTDPLLASVRQHVLQEAEDDAAAVKALVRLLTAYSEIVVAALDQKRVTFVTGLEGTVFEKGKEYLGDE